MGSFAYGLVIAASGAGLAVAAHHVFAPPGPESEGVASRNSTETASVTLDRWARLFGMHRTEAGEAAAPGASAPAADATSEMKADVRPDAGESQRMATAEASKALVRNIQTELQRVGCYAGSANGSWDMQTQLALSAFNEIVKVQIRTNGPEYVHLTLLQGHGTRACARPCAIEDGVKGCLPRPTVAKARPAPEPKARPADASGAPASPRVAALPPPPAAAPSPPSSVLIREGSWRPATGAMPAATPQPPAQASPPSAWAPQVAAAPPVVPPLPGRSALGGPSTSEPAAVERRDHPPIPAAAIAPAAAVAQPVAAARPSAPRREAREAPQRERRSSGGGRSGEAQGRSRDLFTRINRESP